MKFSKAAINQLSKGYQKILSFPLLDIFFFEPYKNILTVSINNIDMCALCAIFLLPQIFIYPYTVKIVTAAPSIRSTLLLLLLPLSDCQRYISCQWIHSLVALYGTLIIAVQLFSRCNG